MCCGGDEKAKLRALIEGEELTLTAILSVPAWTMPPR
jgi:hypothetical protein